MHKKLKSIVFLDAKTLGNINLKDFFSRYGNYKEYLTSTTEEVIKRIEEAEVVITNKAIIGKEAIDSAKNLRLICVAATGMNNVNLEYAKIKGISVKNVKNYSTDSVTQHTFALLFSILNHVCYFDKYVKNHAGYTKSDIFSNFSREIFELKGKTFGIIGLGNIGRRVAELAEAFGANVVYYSTSGKNKNSKYKQLDLSSLLQTSDIVSIHAPLNEATQNLINYEKFKLMQAHSILLNTGRGGIINEKDLVKALNENVIGMAGIDVFEKEPIAKDSPFFKLTNPEKIILSPHIAWASKEARLELIKGIQINIENINI